MNNYKAVSEFMQGKGNFEIVMEEIKNSSPELVRLITLAKVNEFGKDGYDQFCTKVLGVDEVDEVGEDNFDDSKSFGDLLIDEAVGGNELANNYLISCTMLAMASHHMEVVAEIEAMTA